MWHQRTIPLASSPWRAHHSCAGLIHTARQGGVKPSLAPHGQATRTPTGASDKHLPSLQEHSVSARTTGHRSLDDDDVPGCLPSDVPMYLPSSLPIISAPETRTPPTDYSQPTETAVGRTAGLCLCKRSAM